MSAMTDQPLYELLGLRRNYSVGGESVRALDGVDLSLGHGQLVAIEGTSGSGKSTLLAILGGLDRPSEGVVRFEGTDLNALPDRELTTLRGRDIGFVFQSFNLIPTLTAVQNVESVMGALGLSAAAQRARALELLARVGLTARASHLPSRLSGGEQQRVAIARALANGPRVVLADEPTGNLDSATAAEIMTLLRGLGDDLGVTVVLVTHDREVAAQATRRIAMRDGRVISDRTNGKVTRRLTVVPAPEPAAVFAAVSRRPARAAMLIGQAAALVAIAGAGAVVLMPQDARPTSATCNASCRQAQAPAARPHLGLQPKPAAVRPAQPTVVPTIAPAVHVLATRAPRPVVTPEATATPAGIVLPPLPVPLPVKVPALPTPSLPVELPTLPTPDPTPSPTAWNPYAPWMTNEQLMALIMARYSHG